MAKESEFVSIPEVKQILEGMQEDEEHEPGQGSSSPTQ